MATATLISKDGIETVIGQDIINRSELWEKSLKWGRESLTRRINVNLPQDELDFLLSLLDY